MKTIMDIIRKYSIFKNTITIITSLVLYDRTLTINIKNILTVRCDATIKEKFRIAL
jgi:hypothetical protein